MNNRFKKFWYRYLINTNKAPMGRLMHYISQRICTLASVFLLTIWIILVGRIVDGFLDIGNWSMFWVLLFTPFIGVLLIRYEYKHQETYEEYIKRINKTTNDLKRKLKALGVNSA